MATSQSKLSRRDFLKLGAMGAAGLIGTSFVEGPEMDIGELQETQENWVSDLQKELGVNYIVENNNKFLSYVNSQNNHKTNVFIEFSADTGLFSYDPEDTGTKDTVRWAEKDHFYVKPELKNKLVVVDKEKQVYSFDEVSARWQTVIDGKPIVDYKDIQGTELKEIMTFDLKSLGVVSTGWAVNHNSGDLTKL